jgi:hypothetical protein
MNPPYKQLEVKTYRNFFYAKIVTDITTRNTEAERYIKNNVQHGPHKKTQEDDRVSKIHYAEISLIFHCLVIY